MRNPTVNYVAQTLPRVFIWRRIQSLMGLWLVVFLIEHLITNSQAALLIGDNGNGFVRAVNFLHDLPYLPVIEIILLAIPILFHAVLGIKYIFTSKSNALGSDGSKPQMKKNPRNHAYSWQRITAWIVLVGLIGHVYLMRFHDYPTHVMEGDTSYYLVKVSVDDGLYTVAKRLGVTLFDSSAVAKESKTVSQMKAKMGLVNEKVEKIYKGGQKSVVPYDSETQSILDSAQRYKQKQALVNAMEGYSLTSSEVVVVASQFGDAVLLNVRNTFKYPWFCAIYTVFVLATCFHAFNGLWTFMLSWGVILHLRSQSKMLNISVGIMIAIALLGLVSIWGTYWVNLKN